MGDSKELRLDDLDLAILTHLEKDGRKSFSDIAADLGVTVSTVSNRVKRLVDRDVLTILGFLNPRQVGFNMLAVMFISVHPPHVEEAAEAIAEFPEVSWVALFSGEFDLVVEVLCRDAAHLTELITKRIHRVVGVRETRTCPVLRLFKLTQTSVATLQSIGRGHKEKQRSARRVGGTSRQRKAQAKRVPRNARVGKAHPRR